MPNALAEIAIRLAYLHAQRVYARFLQATRQVEREQQRALQRALRLVRDGDFGRRHGLPRVRSLSDLRAAVPLQTYEDLRPYIQRVWHGQTDALFGPRQRVLMFATSSGTTAAPKLIPVTPQFVADYRRGWNTFGLKMLTDHPRAVGRAILQSTGRFNSEISPAGIPCGAITGLLARTQKRVVRRYYVGRPCIAEIDAARGRYYALMRLGMSRDVAFAITANPATLIQMARVADEESETLIRDVCDGSLSPQLVTGQSVRAELAAGLRPDPTRARQLEKLRAAHQSLRPRHYWNLEFLACWTGGSMGQYLGRLRDWYGERPVRDIGLLASEGRVSLPFDDHTAAGALDVQSAAFEFIPFAQAEAAAPAVLTATELTEGSDYVLVLTNAAGLVRYRLEDVVRVRGWLNQAPIVEFLHRAGRVASVAGEKLTENQVVAAMGAVCGRLGLREFDYLLAPCWGDPPQYRLICEFPPAAELLVALDADLSQQNEEYRSRRKSGRLGCLSFQTVAAGTIQIIDGHLSAGRGGTAEQYKRQCLLTELGAGDRLLSQVRSKSTDALRTSQILTGLT